MAEQLIEILGQTSVPLRLLLFAGIAVGIHFLVVLIRRGAATLISGPSHRRFAKLRTIATLATSVTVFILYFLAFGLILRELGVSLTAYLASASVVGLAIGFGSQGVVQDVVTGITLIFSDLVDVGDLVEISGQTGIVRGITMRFIELRNAMGASVFVPNRTINNVVNYPSGYVRCIVDVTLPGTDEQKAIATETATKLMAATREQFPGILITDPSVEGRIVLGSGKEILRIKFRIWPNRGQPIESVFVQEMTAELRRLDPGYQTWMIPVTYEVERREVRRSARKPWRWRKAKQN